MLVIVLLLLSKFGLAQQLENSGFEDWEKIGDTQEPIGWNTILTGDLCRFCSMVASQRAFPDSKEVIDGKRSIRIESKSILGGIVFNGSVTTGRIVVPSASATAGYNQTKKSNIDFNQRLNSVPDSLVFWAKYNIEDSSDSAFVVFVIHGNTELQVPVPKTQKNSIIATIRKTFQTNGEWERISIPFTMVNPYISPEFILATFSSSFVVGKGNGDAKLWVDKVELVYTRDPITMNQD